MPPPYSVLTAQAAEQQQARYLEQESAALVAAVRALAAVDPWLALDVCLAGEQVAAQLTRCQEAHQHRATVEAEYDRVQATEDARIGWILASEEAIA